MAESTLNLVIIGPKHAGKTVYLTALANRPEVALSNQLAIEIIEMHWAKMQAGNTPDATASIVSNLDFSYGCTIDDQAYNLDFTVPDYDGHLAETLSKGEGSTEEMQKAAGSGVDSGEQALVNTADIAKLRGIIKRADGFIVFMPYGDEDEAAMEKMRHEMHTFINLVRNIFGEYAKIPAPLIIAVNKWDKSPHFKAEKEDEEARKYIQSVPLYQLIYERLQVFFANITVLALSAYGHRSDSPNPVPGMISPWRVTDPITRIVQEYFTSLDERIAEEKADPVKLARTLLGSRAIWARVPHKGYDQVLQGALDQCYNSLITQLQKATTRRQFQSLLHEAKEGAYIKDFTPVQRAAIEQLEAPHIARESKERNRFIAVACGIVAVVAVVGYLFHLNGAIKRAWHETVTADAQHRPVLLAGFIAKYGGSSLAKWLGSAELAEANTQLEKMVGSLQTHLEGELASLERMTDSCKVAEEAKHLENMSRPLAQAVAPATMSRLESVLESSKEICEARTAIESAQDEQSLQLALELLANKPGSEEVAQLKAKGEARHQYLAERKRIAPIEQEFNGAMRGERTDAVKRFIRQHESDTNEAVLAMVEAAKGALPEIFYNEASRKIRDIAGLDDMGMQELKSLVRSHIGDITLTTDQVENIRRAMQEKVAAVDRKDISALRASKIQSQSDLDNSRDAIKKIEAGAHLSLDGGLFEYVRPPDLQRELAEKIRTLSRYEYALKYGTDANWVITALDKNAIGLDCDNFAGLPDARLEIYFSSGMPDQRHSGDGLRCVRQDGGRYIFYFSGRVRPYAGAITLRKNSYIPGLDKTCRSTLHITANDLIRLVNGDAVEFDLTHNCPGITIKFTQRSS